MISYLGSSDIVALKGRSAGYTVIREIAQPHAIVFVPLTSIVPNKPGSSAGNPAQPRP